MDQRSQSSVIGMVDPPVTAGGTDLERENLYFKRFEVNSMMAFGFTNEPRLSLTVKCTGVSPIFRPSSRARITISASANQSSDSRCSSSYLKVASCCYCFTSKRLAGDQLPGVPEAELARTRHHILVVGRVLVVNCETVVF